MKNVLLPGTTSLLLALSVTATAQDTSLDESATACRAAADLIEDGDVVGALDEAKWCVESLQQIKQQQTLSLFPDSIDGFIGDAVENQSAMGMTVIERSYMREGRNVTVTLTTGAATGGLAALAQIGMGLGAASGTGTKMRVQRRTVVNMSEPGSGSSEYMVQLKSAGMLMISSNSLDQEELLEFVKQFPIAELDDALVH